MSLGFEELWKKPRKGEVETQRTDSSEYKDTILDNNEWKFCE